MNVAIPTIWFRRGQTYISLAMRQALVKAGHEVFIYARTGNVNGIAYMEFEGEFNVPNITNYPTYEIPPEIFAAWLKKNKIDVVLFNEEQWQKGLAGAAKQVGCKIAGYVCREFINPGDLDFYKEYDAVICPTLECARVVKELGLPAQYVKWGIDLDVFNPGNALDRKDNTVRFFHPAGWGGMCGRRGTKLAIEAFKKADVPNAKLLVHMQSHDGSDYKDDGNIRYVWGNLSREDLINYYRYSDVAVLPSKHEGLGLTCLEAQACGLAVLGVDAPPMNEHVMHKITGFNCSVEKFESYPEGSNLFLKAAVVDTNDLSAIMKYIFQHFHDIQEMPLGGMKQAALVHAQNNFDWAKNGQELVRVVEGL